jgi:hypothetical protein
MGSRLWRVCLAATCIPAVVAAQPVTGPYMGAQVGPNFLADLASGADRPYGPTTKITTDTGPAGVASLGWGFGNGLRVELQGSYRTNAVQDIATLRQDGTHLPLANPGGNVTTGAAIANVLYDIDLRRLGVSITPYLGAGAGYGWLGLSGIGGDGSAVIAPKSSFYNRPVRVAFSGGGAFAYHFTAGLAVPLDFAPRLHLTVGYDALGTTSAVVKVTRTPFGPGSAGIPSLHAKESFASLDQSVLLGVRYDFGTP